MTTELIDGTIGALFVCRDSDSTLGGIFDRYSLGVACEGVPKAQIFMVCPYCGHNDSRVIDSRDIGDGVRRRRACFQCGLRYTTYERVQATALLVVKRDGRREEFNRDKLLNSVRLACAKRPLPTGTIDRVVSDVEAHLQKLGRAEIPSATIGEMVVQRLRKLDRVSYIRFASVYRDFADLETFKEEVDAMLTVREAAAEQVPDNQPKLFQLDIGQPESTPRRRGRPPKREQMG